MTDENALPGLEMNPKSPKSSGFYGAGPTEEETREAIAEIEAHGALTGAKRTVRQLAISLAKSIDMGNTKGRAIANEATQLFFMMQQLEPPEEAGADDSKFSPETRKLLDAFASGPQLDAAPTGYDEA